jgi:hypothetical protein
MGLCQLVACCALPFSLPFPASRYLVAYIRAQLPPDRAWSHFNHHCFLSSYLQLFLDHNLDFSTCSDLLLITSVVFIVED